MSNTLQQVLEVSQELERRSNNPFGPSAPIVNSIEEYNQVQQSRDEFYKKQKGLEELLEKRKSEFLQVDQVLLLHFDNFSLSEEEFKAQANKLIAKKAEFYIRSRELKNHLDKTVEEVRSREEYLNAYSELFGDVLPFFKEGLNLTKTYVEKEALLAPDFELKASIYAVYRTVVDSVKTLETRAKSNIGNKGEDKTPAVRYGFVANSGEAKLFDHHKKKSIESAPITSIEQIKIFSKAMSAMISQSKDFKKALHGAGIDERMYANKEALMKDLDTLDDAAIEHCLNYEHQMNIVHERESIWSQMQGLNRTIREKSQAFVTVQTSKQRR
jgi:hypothetical protein